MNINLFKKDLTSVGFTRDDLKKVETEGDSVILTIISEKINDLVEDQSKCEQIITEAPKKYKKVSQELLIKRKSLEKNKAFQRKLALIPPRADRLLEVPQTENRCDYLINTYQSDIETSKAQLGKKISKEEKKHHTDLIEQRTDQVKQLKNLKMSWELPKAAIKLEQSIRKLENEVDKWKSDGNYVILHKQMFAEDDEKLQKINQLREQIVQLVDINEAELEPLESTSSEASEDQRTGSLSSSTVEPYDISSDISQSDIDQFNRKYSNFLEGLEDQLDHIVNDNDPSTQTIFANSFREKLEEYLVNRKKFGIDEPPESHFQGILAVLKNYIDLE